MKRIGKRIRVGVLGLGTVGCGVVEVLRRNADEIARRAGCSIDVVAVAVRDLEKPRSVALDGIDVGTDAFALVRDASLDIVIELIGGIGVARELVLEAIASGKHIVTANKALIAEHGNEIFPAARDKGVIVAFEAAVAGGVPIIKAIREGLAGNRIGWLAGIINGTGNFILSEMYGKGKSFDDALAEAQALGYAESDPAYDIDGTDAAHKLAIMASIAFGIPLQFDRVVTGGITGIDLLDMSYADELGYRIKHLGVARRTAAGVELWVHPALVSKKRLLAKVEGVMNAVVVAGDAVGPTLYYGAGAGAGPTASAVVADLLDTVRGMGVGAESRVTPLAFQPEALVDLPVLEADEVVTEHYLRLSVKEQVGVLSKITQVLADHGISIEAVLQRGDGDQEDPVSIAILTHKVRAGDLNGALAEIENFDEVTAPAVKIKVETLD